MKKSHYRMNSRNTSSSHLHQSHYSVIYRFLGLKRSSYYENQKWRICEDKIENAVYFLIMNLTDFGSTNSPADESSKLTMRTSVAFFSKNFPLTYDGTFSSQ